MKTNFTRNALIGAAFLASLVMIYFGINFLKGVNIFQKKNTYVAVFKDVSGLLVSSPVYVKGYKVGIVNTIQMVNTDPMQFAVDFNLQKGFKIPLGSTVEFGPDLLGGASVSLLINDNITGYFEPGDTIKGARKVGMMDGAANIVPKADSILIHVDSAVVALRRLMTNPMWEKSIISIGATVEQLNASGKALNAIMNTLQHDLPGITQNLSDISTDLKQVSSNLSSVDIQKTVASIDETVDNLKMFSDKMNSKDNSLGKLMNDTQLHDSLSSTINTATQLLEDIRKNPKRYLSIRLRLF